MRFWTATIAVALLLLAPAVLPVGTSTHAAELHNLEIVTKSGVRSFSVELAVTEAQLNRGLMFRTELPEGRGMLFDFKRDQPVGMWMKDTPLSSRYDLYSCRWPDRQDRDRTPQAVFDGNDHVRSPGPRGARNCWRECP